MKHSSHKIISTLEALINSIDHDAQVYRWFSFLVTRPKVRAKCSKVGSGKDLYRNLDRVVTRQRLVLRLGFLLIVSLLCFHQYTYLGLTVFFIFLVIKFQMARKRWVKEISTQLLVYDFDLSDLRQTNLHQISELYSRQYNVPSFEPHRSAIFRQLMSFLV